jgi:hypothetical protein
MSGVLTQPSVTLDGDELELTEVRWGVWVGQGLVPTIVQIIPRMGTSFSVFEALESSFKAQSPSNLQGMT